jgi:hypothetical protein
MVLGAAVSGLLLLGIALLASRRVGPVTAYAAAGLVWSLVVIALVTLVPAAGPPGYLQPDEVQTACSFDYGGPAPDGFWIFSGGQRLLNTALFVPSGALLVVVAARWRVGWLLAPLGLGLLAAYSLGIEYAQLVLARIDRACDVTDLVDNVTGAAIGFVVGLGLVVLLRPWRERDRELVS